MKLYQCLVLSIIFATPASFAVELTGSQLYQEMSTSQKEELEVSLKENELELNDYLNTKITIDETSNNISISPAACCDEFPAYYKKVNKKPLNYKYKKWVYSGGITYLFPIGPGVTGEIAYQNKKGYKIFKSEFSATTTGTFQKGAVQSYQWNPSVQFGKAKLHMGPVFQMLHVNNPGLSGQQNFFYKAMGANLGYEFTKNVQDRRWTFDLYMQSTLGGFHQDPTPFILVGGGLSIKYSSKTMKRRSGP